MLRSIIDSEKLIEEVRKRPSLYDGNSWGNHDARKNERKTHWEEITKDIFLEVWDSSNTTERDALVKEVQVKWKSLRDAFNRVRKVEKDEQAKGIIKSRKKYLYYDQLSFLEKGGSSSPTRIFLQESDGTRTDDSLDQVYFTTENSNPLQGDHDMSSSSVVASGSQNTHAQAEKSTDERIAELLKAVVTLQKDERKDDRMGNKKFLLSLLPFMEKLPDDVNLEVRLQLMSVLQTYSNGESFMKL